MISRLGWMAYALAALVIAADQASKYWIMTVVALPERATMAVAGPLQFTRIWNRGVSFGLFQAEHGLVRWALVAFSVIVAAVLIGWTRKTDRPGLAMGLGLIIGGAVGNAIDRVRYGAVIDFVDVTQIGFPWIFNVADAAINVGVVLLLLDSLRRDPASPATVRSDRAA